MEKTIHMEKEVAVHLGKLKRDFESGALNEDNVENGDETHLCINLDNGRTLGFIGDEHVKYADVVSGGIVMTMFVRITGGKNAYIQPPFMILQNENCSYPMRNLPDNIPGVSYRTGPRGWMDRRVMAEMLAERRAIRPLDNKCRHVLFLNNCGGHNETRESAANLAKIVTEIRLLPKNSTHLTQPADSFVIQKIKQAWQKGWDAKKVEMIKEGDWKSVTHSS
jgi:DDE superfamily endonuclease